MVDLEWEHDRAIERESYTAIYAVEDLVIRTAILRVFGQMQSERARSDARMAALEADERDRQKWFAVLRWIQTILTAVITALAIAAAQRLFR